jgi:hypothetical protein
MIARILAAGAALAMAATPCLAAEIPNHEPAGARRSSAVAGAYFRVPLSRDTSGRARPAQAGLRLSMRHDYRSGQSPTGRLVEADGLDLRLAGAPHGPTFYAAGRPVTGEEARRMNLSGGNTGLVIAGVVVVALVVGYVVLEDALGTDPGDDE